MEDKPIPPELLEVYSILAMAAFKHPYAAEQHTSTLAMVKASVDYAIVQLRYAQHKLIASQYPSAALIVQAQIEELTKLIS